MEQSRFVIDDVYEHFNAPKWVDFTAAEDSDSDSDEAWFCRDGCDHQQDWVNAIKHQNKPNIVVNEVAENQDSDSSTLLPKKRPSTKIHCGMRYCCLYSADVIISWADDLLETDVSESYIRFIRWLNGLVIG